MFKCMFLQFSRGSYAAEDAVMSQLLRWNSNIALQEGNLIRCCIIKRQQQISEQNEARDIPDAESNVSALPRIPSVSNVP